MKRTTGFLCVAVLIGLMSVAAQASVSTIMFNGSDIVAPCTVSPATIGTPAVGDGYIGTSSLGIIRTYNNGTDPVDQTAFNSWLNGLTTGQGLSGFNLWLQDGLSNQAGLWGETLALADPKTDAANIVPFASAGWTATVHTIGNEWGPNWVGSKLISYTANSSDDYLKPGTTATFGFTADIISYQGGKGPNYQMWVGAGNASNSDTGENQLAGAEGGIYFQRAISATATPEPATLIIWSLLGGLGLVFAWRKRKSL